MTLTALILSTSLIWCHNGALDLKLTILDETHKKTVQWQVYQDKILLAQGTGPYQHEGPHAFSSFDEHTAIAYDNSRAVFVLSDNTAIGGFQCR